MSSADTTSINELPSDPTGGGNINFTVNEASDPRGQPMPQLDQNTINQIVSGLQQANTSGATNLPSRDIPITTQGYTQDPQIQPNYIPPASNADYIRDYEDNNDIINSYNRSVDTSNSLDRLYDELQIPLLIAVLFFLFQLPAFKKLLFRYLPVLFFKDGNINIYGYVFTSILFGLIYYITFKVTSHFSKF
jgi:hypothetical protein